MTLIELANYILPFITIPYIVRVVGIEKFGVIIFAYAFIAYFQIVTEYGFKLIGAKDVSIHRHDLKRVGQILSTILSAQLILFIVSTIIFVGALYIFPQINSHKDIFLFSFVMILGNILFPIWFFQGMEEMKYIAIFNIISRTIYTILIFILIQAPNDYILIPLLNSLTMLSVGVVSLIFIRLKFKTKITTPSLESVKHIFVDGWYLFISAITVNLYTTSNILLLGVLGGYTIVGLYSLADKIYGAIVKILRIFNQVIYPYLSQYHNNINCLIQKTKKLLYFYVAILGIVASLLFFLSPLIIELMYGVGNDKAVSILQILSLSIVATPLGGFFTQYLIIRSKKKEVLSITFKTMLLNFIYVIPLILFFDAVGLAIAVVLTGFTKVLLNSQCSYELFRKAV
tara:strand:- start:5027 stop:6226 length:1200 start_codon:yes stop_codon:yes gene_type:complete